MGLSGFEPESRRPERHRMDQATPQSRNTLSGEAFHHLSLFEVGESSPDVVPASPSTLPAELSLLPLAKPPPGISWTIPGLRDDPTMCLRCRSARLLCGKPVCPLLLRFQGATRTFPYLSGRGWDGSTPPGVFVGRFGYPYVNVGPLLAPQHGDTLLYDTPERWVGRPLQEIVGFRTSLLRGTYPVKVTDAEGANPIVEEIQMVSLSSESSEGEAKFRKAPQLRLELSDDTPPYGPTAPLEALHLDVRRVDPRLERSAGDIHATARIVVEELYGQKVPVSRIQRALSAGVLGRRGHRRFVPTRWSITAVDDLLGKANLERIRMLPELSEWWLYTLEALGNRWFVLFLPGSWRYESIEAWYPGTLWNPEGANVLMLGDHEGFRGRTQYAGMGGCYYAGRLAITEKLLDLNRQSGALILREIHPGEVLPLGVWNVREHVRTALGGHPQRLSSWEEVLQRISRFFSIPTRRWLLQSTLLREWKSQRRLDQYL